MNQKLGIIERAVDWFAASKMANFMNVVRLGWTSYSYIFYIVSLSAILVGFFGWAGWISIIATILFFYYAGKFKEKIDRDKKISVLKDRIKSR